MAQLPFIRGAHGEILHPDEVKEMRKRAARTLRDAAEFRPIGHWTQGLAQLVDAWGGYAAAQRAREAEQSGRENAKQLIEAAGGRAAIEALLLGGDMPPTVAPTDDVAPAGAAPQRPADWLRYANQGAVRNQPISDELVAALSFLPELGIEMEVFSGGQPSEGGARVGSVRHDHGNAADARFFRDGRMLDWSNPEDVPLFQEIVRQARARGVTGFGAGEGYMQPGTMHIGFGDPAIWGAEGRGENAADWLRAAYSEEVAPVEAVLQASPQAAPQQAAGGQQNVVAALMAAAADPWVAQSYGPMIDMALQQHLARQNTAADQAFKREQADLSHARQLERMDYQQALNQADPSYQLGLQRSQLELDALRNPKPEVRTVNNRLVEISPDGSSRVLADYSSPADTDKIRNYEYLVAQGVPPEEAVKQAFQGGVTVNVGDEGQRMGTIPPGFAAVTDPSNPSGFRLEPIPGGPAEQEALEEEKRQAARSADQQRAGRTVLRSVNRSLSMLDDVTQGDGIAASNLRAARSLIRGTPERNLVEQIEDFSSNIGLDRLQQMREASPTGGALGQVPYQQQIRLERTLGSFDIGQPIEIIRENLRELNNIYLEIMFGSAEERAAAVAEGRMTAAQNKEIENQMLDSGYDIYGRPTGLGDLDFSTMGPDEIAEVYDRLSDEDKKRAVERLREIAGR